MTDALPLAEAGSIRPPRHYPRLDLGVGGRNLSPDLTGLRGVFGRTPSFGFSPVVSGLVEFSLFDAVALQLDVGESFLGGESRATEGLAGILLRLPPFFRTNWRICAGGGIAVCQFHGEDGNQVAEGGATGSYLLAGVELRIGTAAALEIYAGYSSYPEISTDYTDYTGPGTEVIHPSVDLSHVMAGLRFKGLVWEP